MTQGKKISALGVWMKDMVERLDVVGQSRWCDMDVVGIYGSQIRTIEMALGIANREAYSYDLHRRNLKEHWLDFWGIVHLTEHQKVLRLLSKLLHVVHALEQKFSYPQCKDLSTDDAIHIVYELKGDLETNPNLPYYADYAGLAS